MSVRTVEQVSLLLQKSKKYGLPSVFVALLALPPWSPGAMADQAGRQQQCAPRVTVPRPVPMAQPGEFRIASQNLHRLFDAVDDGRGETLSPARYQAKLAQLSAQIVDILRSPDVLAVQEAENLRVLEALAHTVQARGGPAYRALLLEGHDVGGIDVGFLLRADLQPVMVEALLSTRKLDRHALFDRPPLRVRLRTSAGQELDIINVHLKSLRGTEDDDVAKKTARKRQRQAEVLHEWLSAELAMYPDRKIVLLGDFNATPEVLGGVDVLAGVAASGMVDVDERLPVAEQYSYVYQCRGEALDHVFLSPALQVYFSRIAISRGNSGLSRRAHEPHAAWRSSDHDGLVLYLRWP